MKVIAAVSDSQTGGATLAVARTLAGRLAADVEAVHVDELPDGQVASAMAEQAGVAMRVVLSTNPPCETLASLLADPDVALMVLGARDEVSHRNAAGHVALGVATQAGKPVVLVPPLDGADMSSLDRVLIPLDGAAETSGAVREAMRMFGGSDVEVVALHVFQPDTVPAFWDKPEHEESVWGKEFVARQRVAPSTRLELRLGSPAEAVIDLTERERPGLIAMAWAQDVAPGRARVVSEVLRRCRVPVLLIPVTGQGPKSHAFGSHAPSAGPVGVSK